MKDIFLSFCVALSLWIDTVHFSGSNCSPRTSTVVRLLFENLDLVENKMIWSRSEFPLLGLRHGWSSVSSLLLVVQYD